MRVYLLFLGSLINGNASSNDAHAKVSLVGPAGSGAVAANADNNSNIAMVSPTHYAVPKANASGTIGASGPATKIRIQLVPDFHQGKHDMGELLFLLLPKTRIFRCVRYSFF